MKKKKNNRVGMQIVNLCINIDEYVNKTFFCQDSHERTYVYKTGHVIYVRSSNVCRAAIKSRRRSNSSVTEERGVGEIIYRIWRVKVKLNLVSNLLRTHTINLNDTFNRLDYMIGWRGTTHLKFCD